jgi:hypothetical protein
MNGRSRAAELDRWFRRRVVIAYAIEPTAIAVLGVFYGGQDFETLLERAAI